MSRQDRRLLFVPISSNSFYMTQLASFAVPETCTVLLSHQGIYFRQEAVSEFISLPVARLREPQFLNAKQNKHESITSPVKAIFSVIE